MLRLKWPHQVFGAATGDQYRSFSLTSMEKKILSAFLELTPDLATRDTETSLSFDTIRLMQNRCSFYGFMFEDPNQHPKDFLKLVELLDLDVANRERMHLCLFQFFLHDQASNWIERLPTGSISTWDDLITRFLAQFFPLGRTSKLRNDILIVGLNLVLILLIFLLLAFGVDAVEKIKGKH
nr:zinc finger, CCHC-type [Tanacetum cinerariifolium]